MQGYKVVERLDDGAEVLQRIVPIQFVVERIEAVESPKAKRARKQEVCRG